jgi:hypothetical protein
VHCTNARVCVAQILEVHIGMFGRNGRKYGHSMAIIVDKLVKKVWIFEPSSWAIGARLCNMRPGFLNKAVRAELRGYSVVWYVSFLCMWEINRLYFYAMFGRILGNQQWGTTDCYEHVYGFVESIKCLGSRISIHDFLKSQNGVELQW